MTTRKWKAPTPTQEFNKAMKELDAWIVKDMIASDAEIKDNIRKIIEAKGE